MARDWHETFKNWSKPPSETEEDKAARTADMIRSAIRNSPHLASRSFDVYATGSYANNTNVRLGSDMDVAIVLKDAIWSELPPGVTTAQVGLAGAASYDLGDFRSDVHRALAATFGNQSVTPRDKTIEVRANASRISADATPFLQHRRYTRQDASGRWLYLEGSELRPHSEPGRRVINWHRQHYDAGVTKNRQTARRYKRVVRILKKLSLEMESSGSAAASLAAAAVPSFLIECLVYNVPNGSFNQVEGRYYEDVREVVRWLWSQTKDGGKGETFTEVSELKPLFAYEQQWTMKQANDFLLHAWKYMGF